MQEPERNWHKIFFYLSLSLLCTRMEEPQVQEPKGKSHKCKSHKCKSHKCKRQRLPLMFPKQSQKNASRVASGKRLVERNRLARKAKKKKDAAKAEAASPLIAQKPIPQKLIPQKEDNISNVSGFYILFIVGFPVSLVGLYYKRQEVMAVIGSQPQQLSPPPPDPAASPPQQPAKMGHIRPMD